MKKRVAYIVLLCLGWTSVLGASAFQDLDFESATLSPPPTGPGGVFFAPAFPGWSGFAGTNQLDTALYDATYLDSAAISIVDTNPLGPGVFGKLIDGNYTVVLQAGNYPPFGPPPVGPTDVSLSQTGIVPTGTKTLAFYALPAGGFAASPFAVSLGGSNLTLVPFPVAGENYTLYEADVSAFAGLDEELKFTLFSQNPHVDNRYLSIDDIMFSPDAIPEPSSLNLLVIGIVGLGIWRVTWRKTS
jgi:hypothetical protein